MCLGEAWTQNHCVLCVGTVPLPSPDSLSSGPASPPHPWGPLWSTPPPCESHPLEAQMGNCAQSGGGRPGTHSTGGRVGILEPCGLQSTLQVLPQTQEGFVWRRGTLGDLGVPAGPWYLPHELNGCCVPGADCPPRLAVAGECQISCVPYHPFPTSLLVLSLP